jgi:hypothetical protein
MDPLVQKEPRWEEQELMAVSRFLKRL